MGLESRTGAHAQSSKMMTRGRRSLQIHWQSCQMASVPAKAQHQEQHILGLGCRSKEVVGKPPHTPLGLLLL
jgi:hypothetical protein